MKIFLKTINVLTEKYQPSELFVGFSSEERANVRTYNSCINALYISTKAIDHFTTMTPPQNFQERYLVTWGVLQAFIIQQDAIRELHSMFVAPVKKKGFKSEFKTWHELRRLRDATAGHPVGHANSIGVLAKYKDEWGVLVKFPVWPTPIHPYVCDRIPEYEAELLEAFKVVTEGLQRRVDEVRAIDLERERRLSGS